MQLGTGRGQLQQLAADEPVVDDHVGPTEELGAAPGQQPRVAGSGADQRDAHDATAGGGRRPPGPRPSPIRRGRVHRRCRGGTGPRPDRARRDGRRCDACRRTTRPSAEASMPVNLIVGPSPRSPIPLPGPMPRPLGMGTDRQGAPTSELGQEGALGPDEEVSDRDRRCPTAPGGTRRRRRRHSTASAPWPTWGSITPGSSTSVSRPAGGVQPSRSMAALATTTAATSPVPAACQAGGQVAPQPGEGEVGTQVGQLDPAPGRSGGHRGPGGQGVEAAARPARPGRRPARAPPPAPGRGRGARPRTAGPWPSERRRRPRRR